MKCDFCSNEASIEIVVFVNGEAKKVHMCHQCYQEKMNGMLKHLPKEMGGEDLSKQLREMLEQAEKEGGLFNSMQFKFHAPGAAPSDFEDLDPEDEDDSSLDEDDFLESHREGEASFPGNSMPEALFEELFKNSSGREQETAHRSKEEEKSQEVSTEERMARLKKKRLRRLRTQYLRRMQLAIAQEDYEQCAIYRDELKQIADQLVRLNEERRKTHGV